MKDWCKGFPEATEFSLFPPAGQVRAWAEDKERTKARLREVFPDLTFAITDIAIDVKPVVIPILGEAGEGGRGIYAAPPSRRRHDEIEAALSRIVIATD